MAGEAAVEEAVVEDAVAGDVGHWARGGARWPGILDKADDPWELLVGCHRFKGHCRLFQDHR